MKYLVLALTLFTPLAHSTVAEDAKLLHNLITEAGKVGHTCTMLIDLNQPAQLHCDNFRQLAYQIHHLDTKYRDNQLKHQLIMELQPLLDHKFKSSLTSINETTIRLGSNL